MKRLLFIAYYFPPLGMGGVQRAVKFVKYLPEFGWSATVLTVDDIPYYAFDPTLLDEIKHVSIERVRSLDPALHIKSKTTEKHTFPDRLSWPARLYSRAGRLCVPDNKIFWLLPAYIKAVSYTHLTLPTN